MEDLAYPIKLDDDYPCRGTDAFGEEQTFDDLLKEGMEVGPRVGDDTFCTGVVVKRSDGLWAIADYENGEP